MNHHFVLGCSPRSGMAWLAVLSLLLVFGSAPRAATPKPGEVPDTLEQRLTACAACHGKQGEGATRGEIYPRLAGKPAGYLFNQLINFRDGRRKYAVMNYMVGYLSDAYLREIAEYYSRLKPPYPAPAVASQEALQRGRTLVVQGDRSRRLPPCTACHGRELNGMAPAIPGLVGLSADYVSAQMGAWKADRRVAKQPDCMARVASLLTPEDIAAVSAWLAHQSAPTKPPAVLSASVRLPLQCGSVQPAPTKARAQNPEQASPQVMRGEYLARAGDCAGCHTVKGREAYAGGLPIPTPFGTLFAPNITPDPETGIGKWTAEDFWRAMHEGRSRDGALLYPAFPYTNYTKVVRADVDDLFAYFQSLKPVRKASRQHELAFPYNQRKLLVGWRALYFKAGEYKPDPSQSSEWNRGAYLVEGLGHCDACHSPRNMLGAVSRGDVIAGGLIPIQNWYAPSLTSSRETGLGDWEVSEVADLLKTGVSTRGAVFGPMSTVVHDSLQHMTLSDVTAMATYLKSQAQETDSPEPPHFKVTEQQAEALVAQGAKLYDNHCADCHQASGHGVPRIYPPLAGNESIGMRYPINAIRIVVNGGFPPSTHDNPRPYGMPPFGQELSDEEIAAVVSYVRESWGNHAPAVSPAEITSARAIPVD